MAYTAVPTVNTGDPWSASDHNTYIKDNLAYLKTEADKINTKYSTLVVVSPAVSCAVGDSAIQLPIPESVNGWNLTGIKGYVVTAGVTGTMDIQIRNATQTADMLSTKLTIDAGETSSNTAATAAVIDTNNDDVATNDIICVDIDAVNTTPALGLVVELKWEKP